MSSISFSWAVAVIRFDRDVAPGYGPTDAVTHHPTGYWLEPTLLAQAAGLPIAWNAVQVFGEPPDWLTGVLGAALERVGLVAVRDEPSLRTIAPFAPQARIVPDTGFGAEALVPQDASASFGALCQEAGLKGGYVVCQASHRLTQNPAIASFLHRLADDGLQLLELPISPILGDRAGVLDLPLNVARLSDGPPRTRS